VNAGVFWRAMDAKGNAIKIEGKGGFESLVTLPDKVLNAFEASGSVL
jgi:hypothetical protein